MIYLYSTQLCLASQGTCKITSCPLLIFDIIFAFLLIYALVMILIHRRATIRKIRQIFELSMNTNNFSKIKDYELIYFYTRMENWACDSLFEKVCDEIAARGLESHENLGRQLKLYFACGQCTMPAGYRVLSNVYLSNKFIYWDHSRRSPFKISNSLILLDAIQSVEIFTHKIKGCMLILKIKGANIITTEYIIPNVVSTWVNHFESAGIPVKDSRK